MNEIFSSENLQKFVNQQLAGLPESKNGAFVCSILDDKTVEIRIATRIGKEWTVGGVVYHGPRQEWNKGWNIGTYITGRW